MCVLCELCGEIRKPLDLIKWCILPPVRVDGDYHRITLEGFEARLQRRALAPVFRVTQHLHLCKSRHLGEGVRAAFIYDDGAI